MSAAEQRMNHLGTANMVVSTAQTYAGRWRRTPRTELVPTLDGRLLSEALGEDRGSGGFMLDYFDALGDTRPVEADGYSDGDEGAARLGSLVRALPDLPPGFAILFMCPCGDPYDGSVGVKIAAAPSMVTWSEPTEIRPDWAAEDPLETWELIPRPNHLWRFDRNEYYLWVAEYLRSVKIRRHEFEGPVGAPTADVRWNDGRGTVERSWVSIRNALVYLEVSPSWFPELWDQLSAALVEEDPLCLSEVGDVLKGSYDGAVRDLSRRISARRFRARALHWLGPYFEQVWDRPVDADALRRVAQRLGRGPAGN